MFHRLTGSSVVGELSRLTNLRFAGKRQTYLQTHDIR